MIKVGIMQGRLSKPINGKIQSFPKDTWREEFHLAKKIGFDLIEWVLDDDLTSNPIMDKEKFIEIKKIKEETDVNINSICCDFFMNNSISKVSRNFKKENLQIFDFLINEACPENNIKIISLPLMKDESLKQEHLMNDYINIFLKYQKNLKKNNLQVSIESDLGPLEFQFFLNKFDNKLINVNYDMGNSAYFKFNVDEEFKNYGDIISNIHVKDCTPEDYTTELGKGNVNFEKTFSLIRKHNYKNNLILQAARKDDEYLDCKNQLLFTKKIMNEKNL
jgi:L-ribulose-5-phosphate 3-epimerase